MKTKIDLKFEEDVYKRYYPLVYTTCKRFLVDKCFLSDATQSVFLLYIKKEDQISTNLSSWFYWASVNICKVVNKDSKKHLEKSTPLDENTEISDENKSQEEFFLDLGGVLEKLPTKKRDMLLMRFYENKTYREIGAYFKCKEDSVRMMIDRTLLYLKDEVKRKEVLSSVVFAQFFGLNSPASAIPTTNQFILQNSLLQQSFIKGVQKMYLISKLKMALICVCLSIPMAIPLSSYIFADNDHVIAKQSNDEKSKDLAIPDVAMMSDAALKYLAEKQSLDGSWSDTQFKNNSGITALCCLAFLAEGSRPRVGKYGKNLEKGLEFLLANVQGSGVIAAEGNKPLGTMYEHVFSSMALLLAKKDMPWHREKIYDVLAKSVQVLTRSQKTDGGWRYDFSREGYSDMSVTANVLWLLKTCNKSGYTISKEQLKRGEDYIVNCSQKDGFRYRVFGLHSNPNLDGMGIQALHNKGKLLIDPLVDDHDVDWVGKNDENDEPIHPLVDPVRDRIINSYQSSSIDSLKARRYYLYGCFYASIAMYSMGDKYWSPWFQKASQVLKAIQRKEGEFYDEFENTIYTTAMAAIILQAPKGHLHIYERSVFSETKVPAVIIKSVEEK